MRWMCSCILVGGCGEWRVRYPSGEFCALQCLFDLLSMLPISKTTPRPTANAFAIAKKHASNSTSRAVPAYAGLRY